MPHRRPFWGAAAIVAGALALVFIALRGAPAVAQEADSYTVRDVQVDVTADNVNVARQQAFAKGQRDAFARLVARFTVPEEAAHLPELSDSELDDLVLDVGVDAEKRSTVRYIATLSVRFKPEEVKRLLASAGIAYTEWRGRPVIVLPVLKTDLGPILWEPTNQWREAWKGSAAQGLVPMQVPKLAPNARQPDDALVAATAGPEKLADFAARFDTQDLLVATAVIGKGDNDRATLDIVLTGSGAIANAIAGTRDWQAEEGEALPALLTRAVGDIAASVNDAFKRDNMLPAGDLESLAVMVSINGLPDWTQLRQRLTRTTAVRSWEVGAISQISASLVLHYLGQQQNLESALVQNGLVLSWADDHWVLQTAQPRPAEAPAASGAASEKPVDKPAGTSTDIPSEQPKEEPMGPAVDQPQDQQQ